LVHTNVEVTGKIATIVSVAREEVCVRVDLDSHAGTCCIGNGVLVVNQTEKTVRVTLFLKSLGLIKKDPVLTVAIAIQRQERFFILLVHQALYFLEMNNCLLSPMQLRLNDIEVNEQPKF
jgi:hypothetical protein